ncbi:MAG: type II toxin-antitoxin system HicA family toxin [Parcubacteria group bacterium]|nr:type II toxin-antitoxin system HicA family toxin [Parcubacteria group bacterium]
MPRLVPITPKKLVKILIALGFAERDAQGSHTFFKHTDGRTTVVPMHTKEMSRGLLGKILYDTEILIDGYEKQRK